jgi:anaerobic selenocysteine-containing dehydrogenase
MSAPNVKHLAPRLRQWDGPLTAQLVCAPGRFGLGQVPARLAPAAVAKSICGFCSTGCGLRIHLDAHGQAINLTPDLEYPVNLGMACPKGWEALTPLAAADRATTPLLDGKPVDWTTAASAFATRFKAVQARHGAASVAFLSSGQIMVEEMALLGAFAKFGMGVIHGDGNTRQCMATAVTAYKESFGFDAPPYTYDDFEESDVLVLVGSNLCVAHPIMWQRVMRNPHRPRIIVIDPRRTETANAATQHLDINPQADLTLFYCLAHWLVRHSKVDRRFIEAHTTGFEAFAEFLDAFPPEAHVTTLGISMAAFEKAAAAIAGGERVSFWWTMGVNQGHQAVRTAQAIINLALMSGNIGRPGTGANSITGQCNAMGSRLFSNTTNLLGGHEFGNPAHREKIAAALGIAADRIPTEPGWAYDQILDGIEAGAIRGLWMIGTNGAHSWINQSRFRAAMAKLEFLVVQDMYDTTETARLAHLVLPAAGWGEKEGTFINSERRFGVSHRVSRAPGQALADFSIFRLLAHHWGCGAMFSRWDSPASAFELLKECSRGQPCDITGIRDYAMIEECGGIQWPWSLPQNGGRGRDQGASASPPGEGNAVSPGIPRSRRLFEDHRFFTPDGRARFVFERRAAPPEQTDAAYPMVLLTGRGSSAQWHTQSRTSKSEILRKLYPSELLIEIHPEDARELGIQDGGAVTVTSRRASIGATARVTRTIRRGQVFLPMHDPRVNALTPSIFDPHSRQPAYKFTAVRVEAAR